jgi:hypothetical protein
MPVEIVPTSFPTDRHLYYFEVLTCSYWAVETLGDLQSTSRGLDPGVIWYQFWCTTCAFRLIKSPQCHEIKPNSLKKRAMHEGDNALFWLIDYLRFYVPLKNFSLIWRRHRCWWRAAKFRPMLSAWGLCAGRDLYRNTPAVTRFRGLFDLIRWTALFSRLLRHTRNMAGQF